MVQVSLLEKEGPVPHCPALHVPFLLPFLRSPRLLLSWSPLYAGKRQKCILPRAAMTGEHVKCALQAVKCTGNPGRCHPPGVCVRWTRQWSWSHFTDDKTGVKGDQSCTDYVSHARSKLMKSWVFLPSLVLSLWNYGTVESGFAWRSWAAVRRKPGVDQTMSKMIANRFLVHRDSYETEILSITAKALSYLPSKCWDPLPTD